MKVALDYDNTFTADPPCFSSLVRLFKARGHTVTFVTYRDARFPNHDICSDAQELDIDIVFTGGRQKQHVFDADIWIDDDPRTIVSAIDLGEMYDGCLANNDME